MSKPNYDYSSILPKEAIQSYITRRKADYQKLSDALTQKNYQAFKYAGHQLKGNAVTFGFPELEDLGKSFEEAANTQNLSELEKGLATLKSWLEQQKA